MGWATEVISSDVGLGTGWLARQMRVGHAEGSALSWAGSAEVAGAPEGSSTDGLVLPQGNSTGWSALHRGGDNE